MRLSNDHCSTGKVVAWLISNPIHAHDLLQRIDIHQFIMSCCTVAEFNSLLFRQ